MGVRIVERPTRDGKLMCHYFHDVWLVDGVLYVKVTAHEPECATEDSFQLSARRRVQRWLVSNGYAPNLLNRMMEPWDRSRDIANDLVDAVTYRAAVKLPALEEAVA